MCCPGNLGSCLYSLIAVPESCQLIEDTLRRHAPSLLIWLQGFWLQPGDSAFKRKGGWGMERAVAGKEARARWGWAGEMDGQTEDGWTQRETEIQRKGWRDRMTRQRQNMEGVERRDWEETFFKMRLIILFAEKRLPMNAPNVAHLVFILRANNGYFLKDLLSGTGRRLGRAEELKGQGRCFFNLENYFQEGGLLSREKDVQPLPTKAAHS